MNPTKNHKVDASNNHYHHPQALITVKMPPPLQRDVVFGCITELRVQISIFVFFSIITQRHNKNTCLKMLCNHIKKNIIKCKKKILQPIRVLCILLKRRNIELSNIARADFGIGVAHIAGFNDKSLTSGQLRSQIIKIPGSHFLPLRVHNI